MNYYWEDNFERHILFRGMDYMKEGAVDQLTISEDKIAAIVRGSEYYAVEITLSGDDVEDMYCSCPYAAEGHSCKHMAAVLYAATRQMMKTENGGQQPDLGEDLVVEEITDIDELLEDVSQSELIEFIKELASGNEAIENQIKVRFGKILYIGDVKSLKQEADDIFWRYSDRHGFIDYRSASQFELELSIFLENKVKALIHCGLYTEAFELCTHVFVKTGNQDMDDDGESGQIGMECYKLWKAIAEKCSETERQTMKEWFQLHCADGTVIDYMEKFLVEFLKKELASEEELTEQIKNLDERINAAKETGNCPRSYSVEYRHETLLDERIGLMRKLGASEEEVDDYRRNNWEFREVRDYYAEQARKSGDYARMIDILKESRRKEKKNKFNVHTYSEKIIEAYHLLGDEEKEKAERIRDFKEMGGTGLSCFREIKALCAQEEWPRLRDELLKAVKDRNSKCEILADEKLLDELYHCMFEEIDIELLNRFGFLLKEDYYEPILKAYEEYVETLAEAACNRRRYDELIGYLKRMEIYKGGKEIVPKLARKWIDTYATRKLMVQELSAYA